MYDYMIIFICTYLSNKLPTMSITRDQNYRALLWTDLYYYYFVINAKILI